jgi:phosphopantetheinyl transferase
MTDLRSINDNIRLGLLDLKAFSEHNAMLTKRELEKKGTTYLLKQLLGTEHFELAYTSENKPFLKERSEHISISHSHDKLAIIINVKENTGIDIEQIRDKVRNVQTKFLNKKELDFAADDIDRLITLWAAKEALYKVYGLKEVEFIENLFVEQYAGQEITGRIEIKDLKKSYRLIHEKIDGYKLVYILHEL